MSNGSGPLRLALSAALLFTGTYSLTNKNKSPKPERSCAAKTCIDIIVGTGELLAEPYKHRAQARAEERTTQTHYSFNSEPTMTRPPGFNP